MVHSSGRQQETAHPTNFVINQRPTLIPWQMTPPVWKWQYSPPLPAKAVSVPAILRQWHSASRLGLSIKSLEIDDTVVDSRTLELLNLWIASGGAFNAARQDYFEAWARLDRVLKSPYRLPRRLDGPESL